MDSKEQLCCKAASEVVLGCQRTCMPNTSVLQTGGTIEKREDLYCYLEFLSLWNNCSPNITRSSLRLFQYAPAYWSPG